MNHWIAKATSDGAGREPGYFEMDVRRAKELTITIRNEDDKPVFKS
ncbi:hypothetical protein [Marinicrinis lubricantis]|uniref:Uncharacterized protein n=1 Tax=Marinicrinis lubricantis TaxID=2086470 RepID=A0ABW1IMW8_9BACL